MGLRSGEYGGRYSIRTPESSQIQENGTKADKMLTKCFDKIGDIISVMYFSVIHDKDTHRAWEGRALGQLVEKISSNHGTESAIEQLTTMNSRYCRKVSFVIEPSTTVPSTIPSRFINASRDTHLPCLNGSFFCALFPFLACPNRRLGVLSSFDVSSKMASWIAL